MGRKLCCWSSTSAGIFFTNFTRKKKKCYSAKSLAEWLEFSCDCPVKDRGFHGQPQEVNSGSLRNCESINFGVFFLPNNSGGIRSGWSLAAYSLAHIFLSAGLFFWGGLPALASFEHPGGAFCVNRVRKLPLPETASTASTTWSFLDLPFASAFHTNYITRVHRYHEK